MSDNGCIQLLEGVIAKHKQFIQDNKNVIPMDDESAYICDKVRDAEETLRTIDANANYYYD